MDFLKKTFLSPGASTLDLVKWLTSNVAGGFAAWITVLLGLTYLVAPEVPSPHAQAFLGRLQVACLMWLVAIMFWRSGRNSKLLRETIARATVGNPSVPNISSDPGVQREIRKIESTGT